MRRLIRLSIVVISIGALAVGFFIATIGVIALSSIPFIGSSRGEYEAFKNGLEPVLQFSFEFFFGALAFGGFVALINAVAVSRGVWLLPITLVSLAGGTAAAVSPRVADTLEKATSPVAAFAMRLISNERKPDLKQEARVLEFTRTHEIIRADVGDSPSVRISGAATTTKGRPVTYYVIVSGKIDVRAIIDVNRPAKPLEFRLRCTEVLSRGHPDGTQPCEK